jgi:hypothetical protein
MTFGYVCEIAATSVIVGLVEDYSQSTSLHFPMPFTRTPHWLRNTLVTNEVLPGLYICADLRAPSFYRLYLLWLPWIVYDGALCLLALWCAVGCWRSGRGLGRTDGACIQDSLVAGNASYFFLYAFVPRLDRRVIPTSLFQQPCTGVRRQRRHGTISRGTSSSPLRVTTALLTRDRATQIAWSAVAEGYPAAMEVMVGCRLILHLRTLLVRNADRKRCEIIESDAPWVVRCRPLSTVLA